LSTTVSSTGAPDKSAFSRGVGPALTGDQGWLILPTLGGSTEENPTVSLTPMQGEEFTQRLLTPLPEQKLTLLLRQGYDVDALLRLVGAELRLQPRGEGSVAVYNNRPSDREGYPVFRRGMTHLSAIQDQHALNVEPLHFQYDWTVAADALTPETFEQTYKDFSLTFDAETQTYHVARRINGRVIITNYDPDVLSNYDRRQLHE